VEKQYTRHQLDWAWSQTPSESTCPPIFRWRHTTTSTLHIGPLQPRFPDAYRHNAGAWNAVVIRFRSAAEADDAFQSSLNEPNSVEQRFRQEVALFQFFTNSVSVLDSLAYALHALGNMIDAAAFPLTGQSLRAADFRGVANSFDKRFSADALTVALVYAMSQVRADEVVHCDEDYGEAAT
jgi:hypothetical protein